jgi:alpha-L-rhamnosidase
LILKHQDVACLFRQNLKPSRITMKISSLLLCLALMQLHSASAAPVAPDSLTAGFAAPPDSARPRTWWHWVSGNVSADGITADLQAMKEIGLGGCQLFTVDQSDVKGPVKFMSPEWRGFVKQALGEADRLGLEFSIEGCDGWSESGGPWIKPEQGMQHVVWTEKNVTGGGKISLDLPAPAATLGFYRDIALLAFPMLGGDDLPRPAELKCSLAEVDAAKLIDGDTDTGIAVKIKRNSAVEFDLAYAQPVKASSLTITGEAGLAKVGGELEASADGVKFTKVAAISLAGVSTFPATTGKFFRLKFSKVGAAEIRLAEISLTGARIDQFPARVGMQSRLDIPFTDFSLPADEVIAPDKIIDLTGKTEWTAPPGRWTIIRVGHTGTGATTHPSTTPGLECDKLSAAAVHYHFENMYGPIFADSPTEAGRALRYILLDSWECGCGNWTPLMPQDFFQRRGYEIKRWLPVFTGRVVKDVDSTQKFLWDLRRTVADLLAENHYGVAQAFAHEHHMGLCAEAPGIGLPTVADNLACKGRTDIPMGEFWVNRSAEDNVDDPKEAASAAHIYGRPIVATESFTATANVASWANDPYGLKQLGDWEFCNGVNRFIFHRYAHQPWNDRQPGMSMGPWGINFERSNTWWKQGSAWIDYLTRCEYLLQQGRFVADLLYFYGEGATAGVAHRKLTPEVPAGFDYDVCNAEILLNQAAVENGEIVLQSGMRYRVLVLPETDRMTLHLLEKIRSLVRAGATVYGPKPLKSPSLADSDAAVQKIGAEMWGECDGVKITSHAYGQGRVLWGEPITNALPAAPNFSAAQPGLRFIHRHDGDAEIYFVSNQRKSARTVACTFRVSGKVPELWHPDTGRTETLALYQTADGCTTVPIAFDPVGSVFVVFRAAAPADHAVAVSRDGQSQFFSPAAGAALEIRKATYGIPGVAEKSRDVTAKVAEIIAAGGAKIPVAEMNQGGDPAYGEVKTLTVELVAGGQAQTLSATEGEDLILPEPAVQSESPASITRNADGSYVAEMSVPGDYEIMLASGRKITLASGALPPPVTVTGPWQLTFPPHLGAPASATFANLMSWTESTNAGVKYFSGTATYSNSVEISAGNFAAGRRLILDFGTVKNLAEIFVNGQPLGILWKEPFRVDITGAAKPGANSLEIRVVNLWPNRLIGDAGLPKDQRITWASVHPYTASSPLLPSGLLGPVRICAAETRTLPALR